MDPAWIGAISALAGVAVGGIIETWRAQVAFRRERAWEMNVEQRRRLEQLYESVEEVAEAYAMMYGDAVFIAGTQQPPKRDTPRTKVPWAKLRMLVNLYAPDLSNHLSELYDAGSSLGSSAARVIMESSGDLGHNEKLVRGMDGSLAKFNAAIDAMREAVVERSLSLARNASKHVDARLLTTG